MSSNKTALVTGACGFSGGYVIDELLNNGWSVKATDLKDAPRKSLNKFGNQIEFIPADLTDKDSLKQTVKDVNTVFHVAAIFDLSTPLDALRAVNVQGTRNLIDVCMTANVQKMVLWSSVAVYGRANPKFYTTPITEDHDLNPECNGKYDTSKKEQEKAAMEYYINNDFPISFIRCAGLYGPSSYYGNYTLFYNIKKGILPYLPNNLHKSSVPLVHVEDIARAARFLSDVKKFNGEIYNIADDNDLDLIQTLKFIAANTDSEFGVTIPFPMKLIKPFLILISKWSAWSAKKFRKKVNGKPPIPKLERDLIEYFYGNFHFSNQKIKDAGFKFKYPDRRIGLIDTFKWYDENGWDEPHHF